MKFRRSYSLRFEQQIPESLQLPLEFDYDGFKFTVLQESEQPDYLIGVLETNVETSQIYLSEKRQTISGDEIPQGLVIPLPLGAVHQPRGFVDVISFIGDWKIGLASINRDEIIPENDDDEQILTSFGTREIHAEFGVISAVRTFAPGSITRNDVNVLIGRQSGLRLYAQALGQSDDVGKFRDYWLVLEAGFGLQNQELVKRISMYQPATEIGFSEEELDALYVLRGRAKAMELGIAATNRLIAKRRESK